MKRGEYFLIGVIILSFLVALYFYPLMPSIMPTHWNSSGQIDGYASKCVGLFLLPIILLAIYIILSYVPKIAILKKNIKKFMVHYFRFKVSLVIFLFALYVATLIQVYYPFPMNYFMIPALSFIFYFVGLLMKHSKKNFFIGFRTPWTLNNERVWDRTNELAGKFFVAYSFIILLGLFFKKYAIAIILIPLLIGIAYLFYYSYRIYPKK